MSIIKKSVIAAGVLAVTVTSISASAAVLVGHTIRPVPGGRITVYHHVDSGFRKLVTFHNAACPGGCWYHHRYIHNSGYLTRITVPSRANNAPVFRNGRQIGNRVIVDSRTANLVALDGHVISTSTRVSSGVVQVSRNGRIIHTLIRPGYGYRGYYGGYGYGGYGYGPRLGLGLGIGFGRY